VNSLPKLAQELVNEALIDFAHNYDNHERIPFLSPNTMSSAHNLSFKLPFLVHVRVLVLLNNVTIYSLFLNGVECLWWLIDCRI